MRVGYPASFTSDLLALLPEGIELVPIPSHPEEAIEIDLWIPPPAPAIGQRIWPHLRGVRIILSLMAGTDWLIALAPTGVTICNAQDAHNIPTAEWTVTAILAMLKYLPWYHELQRAADWRGRVQIPEVYARIHDDPAPTFPPVQQEELHGKRVLLVGYGSIGKSIEKLILPFGVEMTRVARTARTEPVAVHPVSELDALLPQAEILILILPHTAASHQLIAAHQLALLPQGALVVNAARGPIVHTDALVDALNAGRIRAAVDVTDPEPLPPEHPLWRCPNLLLTPHVAGITPRSSPRAVGLAAEQIRRLLRNEPLLHVVHTGH